MKKVLSVVLMAAMISSPAYARKKGIAYEIENAIESAFEPGSITVPATGEIEVAFSPNEGSEKLVVKTIDSAKSQIRMLTYSFTSAPIVAALLRAKKRNVDVALVVDYRNNISEDRSGKAKAALGTLATAGIPVRTIRKYPIHHDKTIVVDGIHVETGSFNYSSAAANKNSENVIVLWNNAKLASVYLKHWGRNWEQGEEYRPEF